MIIKHVVSGGLLIVFFSSALIEVLGWKLSPVVFYH